MRHAAKRITALFLMLAVLLSLSGCAEMVGLEAQSLMSPPKITADRQAIYELMGGDQADIKLVYPKNGEYRSAITSKDLNGDGCLEVVSFCMNNDAGGIRLRFFSKDADGTWYSLAEFTSTANQVDKLFFGDITGDGQEEVVVGWGDPQTSTACISAYYMDGRSVQEFQLSAQTYSEMLLTDFDGNGIQELFVLETAGQQQEDGTVTVPLGRLFRFDSELSYVSQTVPLDTSVTRYSAASFVQISSWRSAVVVDGVKADGKMLTQVIGYDSSAEMLISPLSNPTSEELNETDRASVVAVTSRDINGDGVIEIPTTELLLEQADQVVDSTGYRVTWNTYSLADNRFTPVCSSILNASENYLVLLPADEERIACANDTVTRTATFFRYTRKGYDGLVIGREDLAAVTVYSEEEWKAREDENEDEILLDSVAGRVYVLTVLSPELSGGSELIRELTEGFRILSE